MIALVCLPAYHGSARSDLQNKVSAGEILNSYFTHKGFVTGKIEIPELETEVVLKENRFFRKEENVEDVCESWDTDGAVFYMQIMARKKRMDT